VGTVGALGSSLSSGSEHDLPGLADFGFAEVVMDLALAI
jgi:hypothetical protein